jgi:hypothetical protein
VKTIALALLGLAIALAAAAGAAAKQSPKSEKLALDAADVAHAKQGLIVLSDLASGWQSSPPVVSRGDVSQCPWQDYSALTTTADTTADFDRRGAHLESRVEVLRSHAQALTVFRIDTRPGTAECLGKVLRKALGPGATLVSARVVHGAAIGERTVRFRWVLRVGKNRVEFAGIEFVRGRTVGSLVAYIVGQVPRGLDQLAQLMDSRLQVGIA